MVRSVVIIFRLRREGTSNRSVDPLRALPVIATANFDLVGQAAIAVIAMILSGYGCWQGFNWCASGSKISHR